MLLEAVRGHRLEALFVLALATGLRQGELLGLCWSDVDLDRGTLFVRHALQRVNGEPQLVEPKTDRSRRQLALPRTAVEHLRRLRTTQDRERDTAGVTRQNPDLVFSRAGEPLEGTGVTHVFQQALERAGLPKMRFHDLRHACASFLLAEGASMRVIMEQLGHSNIGLTMNVYSHLMPDALRDAADKMEAVLSPKSG